MSQIKIHYPASVITAILILVSSQVTFAVTKKAFDFVVGVDGDYKAAVSAAAKSASSSSRFYIFFPDGQYNVGSLTGDSNQKSTFSTANVSFIGQSTNNTVLFNKSSNEGIGITATMYFNNADNLYVQDMTFYNKANYGNPSSYSVTGRHVAIQEQSKKVIYKNVKLLSTQDTYYSKGTKTYWENGEIHGTTDFICGSGDVYFQNCKLFALKVSALTAPSSTGMEWGYVFNNCTIDGDVEGFTLGRSWNDAKAVFLNTTMKKQPTAEGWGNPMNSVPQVFAEYNSKDASGNLIDLSRRRKTYTKDNTTVTLKAVLSASEAAKYTVENVLSGSDNWRPHNLTVQCPAPIIRQEGKRILWEDNNDALCWVVFKDGKYLANVATNSYDASMVSIGSTITIRAANSMGGLGATSNSLVFSTSIEYSLNILVGGGEGTVTPASGKFGQGASVTLEAVPAVGWLFDHWTGDLAGNTNPATVLMNSDKSVSAYFVKDERNYYSVSADAAPGGNVTLSHQGNLFVEGTKVTVTAAAIKGWKFAGWEGDHTGTDAVYNIESLDRNVSVKASFMPQDKYNYEAEDGTLNEAVTGNRNAGFSGESYVNFSAVDGSKIDLLIYSEVSDEREVTITFSNGSGAPRNLSVAVNGVVQISSLAFEATADWTTWKTSHLTLTLPEGASTITFATVNGQDGPNVDKIELAVPSATLLRKLHRDEKSSLFYMSASGILCCKFEQSKRIRMGIFTMDGKRVLSREVENVNKGPVEIPLSGLRNGVYLARIEIDGVVKAEHINLNR